MKVMVIPIVVGARGTIIQRICKGTGRIGNKRTMGDHAQYNIIKIGQNAGKSLGDLLILSL